MVSQRTRSRSSLWSHVTAMTVDRTRPGYRATVGFNPFRDHEKSTADIAAMVIALVAIVAVLAWAIFSG